MFMGDGFYYWEELYLVILNFKEYKCCRILIEARKKRKGEGDENHEETRTGIRTHL